MDARRRWWRLSRLASCVLLYDDVPTIPEFIYKILFARRRRTRREMRWETYSGKTGGFYHLYYRIGPVNICRCQRQKGTYV